jgi:hypothetical protein
MTGTRSRGPMPESVQQRWQQSLAAVDRDLAEQHFAQCAAAADEDSFSGFLRRCIHRGGRSITVLARSAGVEPGRLTQFLRGEGELQTGEIDQLLASLGVELIGSGRASGQ